MVEGFFFKGFFLVRVCYSYIKGSLRSKCRDVGKGGH